MLRDLDLSKLGDLSQIQVHDLATPDNAYDLDAFVGSVARRAFSVTREALPEKPRDANVVMPAVSHTFTNSKYVSGFSNWLNGARASLTMPAVMATDEETYAWFTARGVDVILLADATGTLARKPHNRFTYLRTAATMRLLRLGCLVVFSELDVFWIHDPLLLLNPAVDFQVSEQGYVNKVNPGFFIAQPTPRAIALMESLNRWLSRPDYTHCWDQALFEFALGRDDAGARNLLAKACGRNPEFNLGATVAALAPNATRGLRWEVIPFEILPHPFKFHPHEPTGLSREVMGLGGVVAVHLFSTLNLTPEKRIACARALGFWTLPLSKGEQRIGPFLLASEAELPKETVHYREALAFSVRRMRDARTASLRRHGWHGGATRSLRPVSSALAPYLNASFAPYMPLQPHGPGTLPNGSVAPPSLAYALAPEYAPDVPSSVEPSAGRTTSAKDGKKAEIQMQNAELRRAGASSPWGIGWCSVGTSGKPQVGLRKARRRETQRARALPVRT